MRVALIGPLPPALGGQTPGGVATHQAYLAQGLAAAGIDAPLLATNSYAPPGQWRSETPFRTYRMAHASWSSREYLRAVGAAHLVRYGSRLARMRCDGSRAELLSTLLSYRRFLAAVRPQLIHVQHPLDRCSNTRAVRTIEGWHTPLVVTAHSLFGEHSAETIERLMAPNLRAADRVIAVSPHIADQVVQLGVEPDRVRVIRSGVDTERFQPRDRRAARQRLALPVDTPVVLFVGNLEPRKQVNVLLRAMARLRNDLPNALLVVVGTGESAGDADQNAHLHQLSDELRLGDTVRFVGRLDDEQLMDAYAAADVFALPSSSEAQGIVALEAMACGLTVIASAVGGLLGTIRDGETGFLVASGESDALAAALHRALRSPVERAHVGAAARRVVEAEFGWPRAVQATVGVYREVLGCP